MNQEKLIALKIEVLKDARVLIERRYRRGLCAALSKVQSMKAFNLDVVVASVSVRTYIREVLGGHAYLEDWCEANGFRKFRDDARKARLKWIDWMVHCLTEDLNNLKDKKPLRKAK